MNKAICNLCGKEVEEYLISGFSHKFGYGTCFDGDTLDLKICSDCTENLITNLINECKINPIEEYETPIQENGLRWLFINNEIIPLG